MTKRFLKRSAIGLLLGTSCICFAQSRITVTGGPGSDGQGAAPSGQSFPTVTGSAATGTISEERIRQIVREELQRAGVLPPPGMNTGPFGVSPNPSSPPGTNGVSGVTNTGVFPGAVSGVSTGRVVIPSTVSRPPAGAGTPRAAGATPGGTAGTISGGSGGVGVATPGGAGATRTPTPGGTVRSPGTDAAGSPGTGASGATGGTTGR